MLIKQFNHAGLLVLGAMHSIPPQVLLQHFMSPLQLLSLEHLDEQIGRISLRVFRLVVSGHCPGFSLLQVGVGTQVTLVLLHTHLRQSSTNACPGLYVRFLYVQFSARGKRKPTFIFIIISYKDFKFCKIHSGCIPYKIP